MVVELALKYACYATINSTFLFPIGRTVHTVQCRNTDTAASLFTIIDKLLVDGPFQRRF